MRVVLDTNVLLPAFFGSGLCHTLLERLIETDGVTIALSEHIISEFEEWATEKFRAPAADVREAVRLLRRMSEIVTPAPIEPEAFPDADDLPIHGTAIAAQAAALITGDKELLALKTFRGVPILPPRAFYEQL